MSMMMVMMMMMMMMTTTDRRMCRTYVCPIGNESVPKLTMTDTIILFS